MRVTAAPTPDVANPTVNAVRSARNASAGRPGARVFGNHEAGTIHGASHRPREFAYVIGTGLVLGDLLFSALAIYSGLALREIHRLTWTVAVETGALVQPSVLIWTAFSSLVFIWLMTLFGSYEASNHYRVQRTYWNVARSGALWAMGVWAVVGLFSLEGFTPRMGVFYCLGTIGGFVGLWRLAAFAYLIQPKTKAAVSSRIIVVGWNAKAAHLRNHLRMDLAQPGEIVGCVPLPGGHFREAPPADVAVLGDYSALPELVRELEADSIILADVTCAASEIHKLISFCQREILNFKLVPEYFPALNSGLKVETLSGVPLLGVSQLPLDRTINRALKRGIDIVGALIGLTICSLVVPLFCVIVYLESPGPVIFRQRRTSRLGRNFFIYKIRSMRLNAESNTGAVWCKQEDPRRLKIGAFMRKTNVDELPQFWNVLKGDMSLVGPRPERPELIEKFKDQIPNYNARHEVRAGLTGWAQIHGLRGDTDLGKRIEADLYYLENWSVMLDLYCIFATFVKVKNAY